MIDIDGAQTNIDAFVSKWQKPLFDLCNTDQKRAAWYLWLRFLLGLRSLRYLAPAGDIAGCYVMARCCLEYDVGISAVVRNAELGDRYMGFDAHAKNKYLKAQQHTASAQHISDITQYMISRYGPDFARKTDTNWYGGFPQLCKEAGREAELQLYVAYCQVAHGTIAGMQILNVEGLVGAQKLKSTPMDILVMNTLSYLRATDQVVKLIQTQLWTPDKQECLGELELLAKSILEIA